MSKRIVISIFTSIAMSIGGFFASCGSEPQGGGQAPVLVQLPEGCTLDSPRDELGTLGSTVPAASVKPGKNQFILSCGGRLIQIDKQVDAGQHTVSFSDDDVK